MRAAVTRSGEVKTQHHAAVADPHSAWNVTETEATQVDFYYFMLFSDCLTAVMFNTPAADPLKAAQPCGDWP